MGKNDKCCEEEGLEDGATYASCLDDGTGRSSLGSWGGDCHGSEGDDSEDLGELHVDLFGVGVEGSLLKT